MDVVLCDELVQEILRRLPSADAPSVSLVSKRWLFLLRSSTASLSLAVPTNPTNSPSLSSILAHYSFLSELTVVSNREEQEEAEGGADALVFAIASAACSRRLTRLRFIPAALVSPSALQSCASAFTSLTSLQIASLFPLSFSWLSSLPFLKCFSMVRSRPKRPLAQEPFPDDDDGGGENPIVMLPMESLSLYGIYASDRGLSWLWRRCGNLRWLQLRACEGTGECASSPAFPLCLPGLLGLELRTCRSIADRILLLAADRCHDLTSLLLYDGGSRDALHHFIHRRGAALHTLDLRLPLDLHNDHLFAIAAENDCYSDRLRQHRLASLRLYSCCLVTGDGLRSLALSPAGAAIEELALVNCDVVERESGLLTFLSQSMQRLRRLDLSHNETLTDKEVGSMLASCRNLLEIRLKGCRALTSDSLNYLLKHRGKQVQLLEISRCPAIGSEAIEKFATNAGRLNRLIVEEDKVTEAARAWLSRNAVKIG